MSNSIADLTSQPVPLKVEIKDDQGKGTGRFLEYLIYPLRFSEHGALQRWIDAQFPDPHRVAFEAIRTAKEMGAGLGVAQEQYLMRLASDQAMKPKHLIGTPVADELLLSLEGIRRILLEGIRKGDPTFDDAKVDELLKHMDQADYLIAYRATQMDLVIADPKSMPLDVKPSTRPTGSTVSRRTRRAAKVRSGGTSGTIS
jgi:hypothetical protein